MRLSFAPVIVFLSAALAYAVPLQIRAALDVYTPAITEPTAQSVWKVGSTQTVTWDTSNPPQQITNKIAKVLLSKGGILMASPLAQDFSILKGSVSVQVPDVEPGNDYAVVLYGDSGNASPFFSIVPATPSLFGDLGLFK